jgi:hypothetical protein
MISDNAKKKLKALAVELNIPQKEVAKRAKKAEQVVSRVLSTKKNKDEDIVINSLIALIKKQRPDIIIEEILNS